MKTIFYQHPALINYDEDERLNGDGIEVPFKIEVCPQCSGTGSHVRKDLDDSALIDSMQEDGDMEGIEAYHKGAYDVVCTMCNGNNVVSVPELPEWVAEKIFDYEESERFDREYEAQERRMGA